MDQRFWCTAYLFIVLSVLPGMGVAQTVIFDDTCATGSDQNLEVRTPDTVGTGYTLIHSLGTPAYADNPTNRCQPNGPGANFWTLHSLDTTYPHADYSVTAINGGTSTGAGRTFHIGCRVNSVSQNGYFASYSLTDTTPAVTVNLWRFDSGVSTKLSSDPTIASHTVGTELMLECIGDKIGVKVNGSYLISPVTDSTYSATGTATLGFGDLWDITTWVGSAAAAVDEIIVTDIAPLATGGQAIWFQ